MNDAELTLARATEWATAACAAAGRIDADHAEALKALARPDRLATDMTRRLDSIRAARTMLVTRDSIRTAERFLASAEGGGVMLDDGAAALGHALIGLLAAAPDKGERLLVTWRDGLKSITDGFERDLARSVHPYVNGRNAI